MDNKMDQWRDGLLSNSEMLAHLLFKQANLISTMVVVHDQMNEVRQVMRAAETRVAEERMKRLGV